MLKKIVFLTLLAISIATTSTNAHEAVEQPRLVHVNGQAEIKVVPDEVILRFSIQTWNQSLEKAKQENDQSIQQTVKMIKTFKLDSKKVQSGHITITPGQPNPDYYDNKIRGYLVKRDIGIILNDITLFDSLIEKLFASGVNAIQDVDFITTQLKDYQEKARLLAVKNAKKKALAMTKELHEKIDRVHSISDVNNYWTSPYKQNNRGQMRMMAMDSSGGDQSESTVSLGEISIISQVNVSFELK